MEFRIIGATALHIDNRSVPLGPLKQRGLLALLLYHAGVPVRTDTIVEYLWPDEGPNRHRPNLQVLISRLRAVLSHCPEVLSVTASQRRIVAPGEGAGGFVTVCDPMGKFGVACRPGSVRLGRFARRSACCDQLFRKKSAV